MLRKICLLGMPLALGALSVGPLAGAEAPKTNASPAAPTTLLSADTVVAKGKGFAITKSELDNEAKHAKVNAMADGRVVTPEKIESLERQVLEQLVNVRLLETKATAADKAAGKQQAEKRFADAKAKALSEEVFQRQLKMMGLTREELLAKWTEAMTSEAVLERELKINISDEDAKKFYEANAAQFDVPEIFRASHILLATRDPKTKEEVSAEQKTAKRTKAEAVLKRARAGEDFALLATEFSNDAGSRARGGDITFAAGKMVPEIETAVLSLKTNQISDIVTSPYGYHIIKLYGRTPAHKIPLAEAAPGIKSSLAQQAVAEKFPEYIAKLRTEAGVEIPDPKLRPHEVAAPPPPVPAPR